MIGQDVIYAPCPCGSGKKFKFCCYRKYRDQLSDDMSLADVTQLIRCDMSGIKAGELSFAAESEALHDEGYDLMKAHSFAEARARFRRSREIDPRHSASWNNEASCAWEMGDYEAACAIQREGNANMAAVDSFGLARLAVYAHATGREEEAEASLKAALSVPPISIYGALEVCYALALYHRHQDILDYVARSGMGDSDRLAFYTGIAHANLGQMGAAELDLRKTGVSQHYTIAERYLGFIRDDVLPWTAEGEDEWPYFDRLNFRPARIFAEDAVKGVNPFERCPKPLVEDCIACLLADDSLATHDALTLLRKLSGDRAKRMAESLERMLKAEADAAAEDEARRVVDVDAKGRPRLSFDRVCQDALDDDWPDEYDELMDTVSEVLESDELTASDDLVVLENRLLELISAHPDCISANMAYFALVERHDKELAKGLRVSYCLQHPDNLVCSGLLLMLYAQAREYEQAAEIVDRFKVPRRKVDLTTCRGWVCGLALLRLDEDFEKSQPAANARVKEFFAAFEAHP